MTGRRLSESHYSAVCFAWNEVETKNPALLEDGVSHNVKGFGQGLVTLRRPKILPCPAGSV